MININCSETGALEFATICCLIPCLYFLFRARMSATISALNDVWFVLYSHLF